jgi:hypothetical protein
MSKNIGRDPVTIGLDAEVKYSAWDLALAGEKARFHTESRKRTWIE